MRATSETSELPRGDELLDELVALLDAHPAGEDAPYLGFIDGTLAGLVLSEPIPSEEWLPRLGAGPDVHFADPADSKRFVDLLFERKAEIVAQLLEGGLVFEPIYDFRQNGEPLWEIWLFACMSAMAMRRASWKAMFKSKDEELATAAFGLGMLAQTLPGMEKVIPRNERIASANALAAMAPVLLPYLVETIYRRRHHLPRVKLAGPDMLMEGLGSERPLFPWTGGPKVGRNQSCPCGSGKKYKKCCAR